MTVFRRAEAAGSPQVTCSGVPGIGRFYDAGVIRAIRLPNARPCSKNRSKEWGIMKKCNLVVANCHWYKLFKQSFHIKREELLNCNGLAANNQFDIRMELLAELAHSFIVFPPAALDFDSH